MDEVFDSSLDGSGNEDFLKIIRYVIKGANIFVISHKTGMEDRFDKVLTFEKVKAINPKVIYFFIGNSLLNPKKNHAPLRIILN